MIPSVNYVIHDFSFVKTIPTGAQHWRKNVFAVITQDRVIDDNLKRQIKNQTLYASRLFLLT